VPQGTPGERKDNDEERRGMERVGGG
jgi:hypothetical protein